MDTAGIKNKGVTATSHRIRSLLLVIIIAGVGMIGTTSCRPAWQIIDPAKVSLPANVASWLESYKYIEVATTLTHDTYTYHLASWGLKDSGLYKVGITGVETGGSEVIVKTKWTTPASFVAVQPHFSYALVRARKTDKPIRFTAEGGKPEWIPSLVGVPAAFRILTASDSILYSHPKTDSVELGQILVGSSGLMPGEGEYVIEGVARVFEGTVEYDLVGEDNQPFGHGFVTAASGGPDWGYFVLRIPVPEATVQHIRVYSTSAEDGSIRDLVLIIP